MENFFTDKENYEKPMFVELELCSSEIVKGASGDSFDGADENDETA